MDFLLEIALSHFYIRRRVGSIDTQKLLSANGPKSSRIAMANGQSFMNPKTKVSAEVKTASLYG